MEVEARNEDEDAHEVCLFEFFPEILDYFSLIEKVADEIHILEYSSEIELVHYFYL